MTQGLFSCHVRKNVQYSVSVRQILSKQIHKAIVRFRIDSFEIIDEFVMVNDFQSLGKQTRAC